MIDWLSLTLPYFGPDLNGGNFVSINPWGEIEYHVDKYLDVEGSYSDKVKVRAFSGRIWISGNPSKFLQGHNLFGSDDFHAVATEFVREVMRRSNTACAETDLALDTGIYTINRIDINQMFDVGTRTDAKNWIRAARRFLSTNFQDISIEENTLYIGKRSRRLTVKIYYKGDEVKKHSFTVGNRDLDHALMNWSSGKIRVEITLRKKYLEEKIFCHGLVKDNKAKIPFTCRKNTLEKAFSWDEGIVKGIFSALMREKIVMPTETFKLDDRVEKLPKAARATYLCFKEGFDIREMLPKATFYRHRRIIRESTGVDISRSESVDASSSNVIPLVRFIEAKPAEIPEWAYEYNLVVCA